MFVVGGDFDKEIFAYLQIACLIVTTHFDSSHDDDNNERNKSWLASLPTKKKACWTILLLLCQCVCVCVVNEK